MRFVPLSSHMTSLDNCVLTGLLVLSVILVSGSVEV